MQKEGDDASAVMRMHKITHVACMKTSAMPRCQCAVTPRLSGAENKAGLALMQVTFL